MKTGRGVSCFLLRLLGRSSSSSNCCCGEAWNQTCRRAFYESRSLTMMGQKSHFVGLFCVAGDKGGSFPNREAPDTVGERD